MLTAQIPTQHQPTGLHGEQEPCSLWCRILYVHKISTKSSRHRRAVSQALSRRLLTAEAPDQSQVMWNLWWTKWHWQKGFSEDFGFPLYQYHSTRASHSSFYAWCPYQKDKRARPQKRSKTKGAHTGYESSIHFGCLCCTLSTSIHRSAIFKTLTETQTDEARGSSMDVMLFQKSGEDQQRKVLSLFILLVFTGLCAFCLNFVGLLHIQMKLSFVKQISETTQFHF